MQELKRALSASNNSHETLRVLLSNSPISFRIWDDLKKLSIDPHQFIESVVEDVGACSVEPFTAHLVLVSSPSTGICKDEQKLKELKGKVIYSIERMLQEKLS